MSYTLNGSIVSSGFVNTRLRRFLIHEGHHIYNLKISSMNLALRAMMPKFSTFSGGEYCIILPEFANITYFDRKLQLLHISAI